MVLEIIDLEADPLVQLKRWYEEAGSDKTIHLPNAMSISTIDEEGFPDNRYVLMKDILEDGILFYTNLESAKGKALKENPKIAANFYWQPFRRQVRLKGLVEKIDDEVADTYFETRDRGSQLGAWASRQSETLSDRRILEQRVTHYTELYDQKEVPRPDFWSGFRIIPHAIEFWQNRTDRLHDRFLYTKFGNQDEQKISWKIRQLFP